jgi:hypothetical protein
MKKATISEAQLCRIINNVINEGFDNFVRTGRWREEAKSTNPVVRTAYKRGWDVEPQNGDDSIEGYYTARLSVGVFGDTRTDNVGDGYKHPKDSWPMLIANLNKILNPHGYAVKGGKYHIENAGEIEIPCGTLLVKRGNSFGSIVNK